MTPVDGDDALLIPAKFVAVTVNVYDSFVRFDTVHDRAPLVDEHV